MPKKNNRTPVPYGGFILTFEPGRTEWLAEQLDMSPTREFSDSFSALDWRFERRELVFLVLNRNPISISVMALMERMHGSGGSGKLKMRIFDLIVFDEPIESSELTLEDIKQVMSTPERLHRLDPIIWT